MLTQQKQRIFFTKNWEKKQIHRTNKKKLRKRFIKQTNWEQTMVNDAMKLLVAMTPNNQLMKSIQAI